MSSVIRIKATGQEAWYHLYSRAAGRKGEYPLAEPSVQQQWILMLRHFAQAFCCQVAAHNLLGNHMHLVVKFELPRKLSAEERMERALRFYPRSQAYLQLWSEAKWERFEKRIFDVSEFMRSLQSRFALWYNRTHERKGRFWADRFKSTLLSNGQAILDAVLYVELNAVRASLVERPEDYPGCSAYLREAKQDDWLMPLSELFPEAAAANQASKSGKPGKPAADLHAIFKELLYHRGAIPTKPGQAAISPETLKRESERGFERSGLYRRKLRFFTDGLMLGGENLLREKLAELRRLGRFLRRKEPTEQEGGIIFSLREQRSHFVPL